jgi:hypothetical protein
MQVPVTEMGITRRSRLGDEVRIRQKVSLEYVMFEMLLGLPVVRESVQTECESGIQRADVHCRHQRGNHECITAFRV